MKQHRRLAAIALLLGGVASAQTYMLVRPTAVLFIQWTEANGQLNGSAQLLTIAPTDADTNLVVTNSSLTGTHSGSDVSLSFSKAVLDAGVTSVAGTLKGNTLTLNVPLASGGLGSVNLNATTPDKFNSAVSALKKSPANQQSTLAAQKATRAVNNQINLATITLGSLDDKLKSTNAAIAGLLPKVAQSRANLTLAISQAKTAVASKDCAGLQRIQENSEVALGNDDLLTELYTQWQSGKDSANQAQMQVNDLQASLTSAKAVLTPAQLKPLQTAAQQVSGKIVASLQAFHALVDKAPPFSDTYLQTNDDDANNLDALTCTP